MIGISGPSGAGKSLLAQQLAVTINAVVISLDSYYRDLSHIPQAERAQQNFDQPEAIEETLLVSHLEILAQGGEVAAPVYDFERHLRSPQTLCIKAAEYVIVEGLFTLYWQRVQELLNTKIFVFADKDLCLARRLERDVRERGRTPESVIEQYNRTVWPMTTRYVYPTRQFADLVVNGADPINISVATAIAYITKRSRVTQP